MTTYTLYLSDPFGTRLAEAPFLELSYTRVVNDVSTLTAVLPGTFPREYLINPDGRIEVWRKIGAREYLDTETVWLIKKVEQRRDEAGTVTIVVEADVPLCILREPGRFVNYVAGSGQASYAAGPADNQILQVARENIGASASGARDISAFISIVGNLGLGASVAKSFAWRDCLKVMQEFAAASTQAGVYCAFDIVSPSPGALEFRTYTGQRGMDHRWPGGVNPVILSPGMGNLAETVLTEDYRDEVTYALAGGQGEGADRLTASSEDTIRQGVSPFGLRELFVDATQYDSTTGLASEASVAVRNGRPRQLFTGRLVNTPDTQYGTHWAWGDFLTAQDFGQLIDCRVEAVTVKATPTSETIDAILRSNT